MSSFSRTWMTWWPNQWQRQVGRDRESEREGEGEGGNASKEGDESKSMSMSMSMSKSKNENEKDNENKSGRGREISSAYCADPANETSGECLYAQERVIWSLNKSTQRPTGISKGSSQEVGGFP